MSTFIHWNATPLRYAVVNSMTSSPTMWEAVTLTKREVQRWRNTRQWKKLSKNTLWPPPKKPLNTPRIDPFTQSCLVEILESSIVFPFFKFHTYLGLTFWIFCLQSIKLSVSRNNLKYGINFTSTGVHLGSEKWWKIDDSLPSQMSHARGSVINQL